MISNFHTVKTRRFGTSLRTTEVRNVNPGPGSYRAPSDFGYLDFKPKSGYTPQSRSTQRGGSMMMRGHRRQISLEDMNRHADVSTLISYTLNRYNNIKLSSDCIASPTLKTHYKIILQTYPSLMTSHHWQRWEWRSDSQTTTQRIPQAMLQPK